jgi:hypothetical protein
MPLRAGLQVRDRIVGKFALTELDGFQRPVSCADLSCCRLER